MSTKSATTTGRRYFGKRVVRTAFLLRYLNGQNPRKRMDGQLGKLDRTYSFVRAVFYGQDGQIRAATRKELQLADTSKRLVQNAHLSLGP